MINNIRNYFRALFCIALFSYPPASFSQIANGDFENWNGDVVLNWDASPTCGPRDSASVIRMKKKYPDAVPHSGSEAIVIKGNTSIQVNFPLDGKYSKLRGHYYFAKAKGTCESQFVTYAVGTKTIIINSSGNPQKTLLPLEKMNSSFPGKKDNWEKFEIDLRQFLESAPGEKATFTLFYISCSEDFMLDNIELVP